MFIMCQFSFEVSDSIDCTNRFMIKYRTRTLATKSLSMLLIHICVFVNIQTLPSENITAVSEVKS